MCNSVHMLIKFLHMKSIFTLVNIHIFEKKVIFFFFSPFLCFGALPQAQVNLLIYSKRTVLIWPLENNKDSPSPYDVSSIIPELGETTLIG